MKKVKQIVVIIIIILSFSCSSDTNSTSDEETLPIVVTLEAQNLVGVQVTLGGTLIGQATMGKGVCWGIEPNPTRGLINFKESTDNITDNFFINTENALQPNTTYHARAFAENSVGIAYGDDIVFTTGTPIITNIVTNILARTVSLNLRINQPADAFSEVGFVWSTSPNPLCLGFEDTIILDGTRDFTFNPLTESLQPNTLYYVKAFIKTDENSFLYGEERQFKTCGYFGPAGGYVAYDKGEISDGWRYFEIYPQTLKDNNNSSYIYWGCNNYFISNTFVNIGKGRDNTLQIVNNCNDSQGAARICNNYIKNGYSDWFLGSRDEMLTIAKSLLPMGVELQDCWTSSEILPTNAYGIKATGTSTQYIEASRSKNTAYPVYAIRRY